MKNYFKIILETSLAASLIQCALVTFLASFRVVRRHSISMARDSATALCRTGTMRRTAAQRQTARPRPKYVGL